MKLNIQCKTFLVATLLLGPGCDALTSSNSPLVTQPPADAPIAGEVLHLEADQGVMASATNQVQRWADLSGRNHNGTAAGVAPLLSADTLAGTHGVRVSGDAAPALGQTQRLDLDGQFVDFSAGLTAFALVRVHVQAASATLGPEVRLPEFSGVGSNDRTVLGLSADQQDGSVQLSFGTGQLPLMSSVTGSIANASDRWVLYSVREDTKGKVQLFADGSAIGEGTVAPALGATARTASIVGGSLPTDTIVLAIYNRALAPPERATVEASITAKWNYRQ